MFYSKPKTSNVTNVTIISELLILQWWIERVVTGVANNPLG